MKLIKRITAILLAAAIGILGGCGDNEQKFNIYYKNADGDALVKEEHHTDSLSGAGRAEIIEYLIGELSKSPSTDGLINVLPGGTQLLKVSIIGRTATVNLSKEYYMNKDVDELLARFAIINTLGEVEGIDSVEILIEGGPLISTTSGAKIGRISKNNVVLGLQDPSATTKETVVIYFPDKEGQYLVPEERKIEIQASLSTERLVMSELLKGPESSRLVQSVPADLKVISTETTDGVCFVNLSGDTVDKVNSGSTSTTMFLYSIVNSLTELANIDSVQILIDGKTGVELGNYVLDAPLEKNRSLIED